MNETLAVTIKKLKPELAQDFLQFFDKDAFSDFPEWAGCYCHFYETPGPDWDAGPAAIAEHREAKAERIRSGKANGLLAYAEGRVVGWCNAQPRSDFVNMRRYSVVIDDPKEPVGSIMCFLVSPGHRRKRIGTLLLNAACDIFRKDGLKVAEAYPTTNPTKSGGELPWSEANYKGPLSMYLNNGFRVHRQLERFAIVRKQL
jgi:GNAT superfamily N-acetyltransferase